jgi:tRNA threonylcarbamoyladenosine biosynthesis protein TsaE
MEFGLWWRMAIYISHSPAETLELGEAWGRAARSGLVIALSGDLGAGKTQLTKGIAHGLGVTGRVHSPTFTLVNEYVGGRLPLFHVDLYRLDTPDQIITAGLEEYFSPTGVSVIEWAERWFTGAMKSTGRYRAVTIEAVSETERRITYEDVGH